MGTLPSLTVSQPAESEAELFLLRSIEWTTFLSTTYPMALEQANMILRYFLGMFEYFSIYFLLKGHILAPAGSARIQLAKRLLEMIPPDLAVISEPEDLATEYLHFRQFFLVWETLEKIYESQSTWERGLTAGERPTWVAEYRVSK